MPIQASDILFKYSTTGGSSGNSLAQADPASSLGKYISTTVWPGSVNGDLFGTITGAQNAASAVDYRCVFVHNAHPSLVLQGAKVWISNQVAGGADVAIGLDPAAASPVAQSSAQAAQIASAGVAPAGVIFSNPSAEGSALSIGDLAPGYCKAVWFRRTATNSAALNNDGATVTVKGDTAA